MSAEGNPQTQFEFRVLASSDLSLPFTDIGLLPTRRAANIEVVVPTAGAPARFYTVTMTAR